MHYRDYNRGYYALDAKCDEQYMDRFVSGKKKWTMHLHISIYVATYNVIYHFVGYMESLSLWKRIEFSICISHIDILVNCKYKLVNLLEWCEKIKNSDTLFTLT